VDALAPVRGQATGGGTTDRVVASLLTELGGVEALCNVVVVGATNRPDLVDPALLRPGRLERLMYVPPPDSEARAEILRAAVRTAPLAPDIDLGALASTLDAFRQRTAPALIREAALAAMRESQDAATGHGGAHDERPREGTPVAGPGAGALAVDLRRAARLRLSRHPVWPAGTARCPSS
jgi:transitional endoplasmic reticulum ATPase